jgi:glycosyltransferase involved in cell wall biosynthesis
MRIAFVDIEDPEDVATWSGTPYFMLQELRRQGVEVEVIAPLKRPFKYLFAPQKAVAKVTGRNLQINRHAIALRSFAAQVERRLKAKRFDAIFSTSSIPVSLLQPGMPVLYWTDAVIEAVADYYDGSFSNMSSRELRIAHHQEQAALDRAAFAIYSSDWAAESVRRSYKISGDKVQVIEFGANLNVDHDLKDIVEFDEQRLRSECVLLFIGINWDRKGGAFAFEAARLLNERGIKTRLKVVGGGGPEAPFVEKLGFINKNTPEGQREFDRLFATSTFFVLPTRAEASAIVFCEASAYGLPIFAPKTGGLENYIIDSQTGYCLPLAADGSAYADLIAATLAAPDTYHRLSIGAFQRYRQTLNWKVGVSSLLKLVEKAIEK